MSHHYLTCYSTTLLPLTHFSMILLDHLFNLSFFLFLLVTIIVEVATTIINVTIISNAITNNEEDPIITIIRITTTIVIKTEILRIVEEIGTTAEEQEHLRAVLVDQIHASAIRRLLLKIHLLLVNLSKLSQSIHAGRNLLNSNKSTAIEEADMVENGVIAVAKLTTLFHCHVMNVLSWSFSARQTLASTLASTKTFPWKLRVNRFPNILHPSMTLS